MINVSQDDHPRLSTTAGKPKKWPKALKTIKVIRASRWQAETAKRQRL